MDIIAGLQAKEKERMRKRIYQLEEDRDRLLLAVQEFFNKEMGGAIEAHSAKNRLRYIAKALGEGE